MVDIKISNVTIPVKSEAKNLGLILDNNLRFQSHVTGSIRKAITNLKILYNSKDILDQKSKLLLCNTLVLSKFNYCNVVYGPCLTAFDSGRIQKIQKYCLRFTYGIKRQQPVSYKLKEVGWLDMKTRCFMHSSLLFYKVIYSKHPKYLYQKISFREDVHNLNLRFKGNLTPPTYRLTIFKRSFSYNIVKIFNSLPRTITSATSLYVFRRLLKEHLSQIN